MKSPSAMTTAIKITALTCLLAAPQALASAPISINPDVLKNIHKIFPLEPSFNIRDPILTNNLNLTLHLPTDAVLAATATFEDRSTNYLKQSMPDTLKQFNVPADQIQAKVDKGTPLIVEAIKELLTQDHDAASHGLQTRSFFGDLLDWAEGAGCALVAATGFGVYMLAAANYKAANAGIPGATTNTDQDFFLHPSHGALSHNAPVTIYYNAAQNPFINIPGITFNRDVYLNTPLVRDYGTQNWQDFGALVQLLIHEFTHVEQYAATGYDLVSYGHSYVYQWCRAGFKYSSIDYEQAAKAREPEVNALLIFGAPGNAYFWIWKFASLLPTLGNPIARTPSVPTTGEAGSELPFELGVLQILDLAANPPQFRVFTNAQIAARAAAQCSTTPDPVCTDLKPKPRLRGRSPTPMQKDGPIIKCTPGDKKAQAKQCRDAKAAWAAAQKDAPWRSDVTVPKPAAPAPAPPVKPVKAGCPPDCEIVTLVPATSKSCRFDEPPPGCDRAWAEENNRVCRAKMGQC